jgi:hypothetical protein
LQPQFLAHLFDSRLDLLNMVHGVVAFPHDPNGPDISSCLSIPD